MAVALEKGDLEKKVCQRKERGKGRPEREECQSSRSNAPDLSIKTAVAPATPAPNNLMINY